MKLFTRLYVSIALMSCAGMLQAQGTAVAPPQNVAQLSASGAVEVVQDMLAMTLNTTREGSDPTTVQTQLKTALDAALAEARKAALPGQLDVRKKSIAIDLRHTQGMAVAQTSFSLSREQRERVEGEAQALAINRFKARAADVARGFGFSAYTLREIAVNSNDQGGFPRPRMMAMEAKAASDAPVPVEAGRSTVQVTVSGSIQMR